MCELLPHCWVPLFCQPFPLCTSMWDRINTNWGFLWAVFPMNALQKLQGGIVCGESHWGVRGETGNSSAFCLNLSLFISHCEHHKDPLNVIHVGNPKKGEEMKNLGAPDAEGNDKKRCSNPACAWLSIKPWGSWIHLASLCQGGAGCWVSAAGDFHLGVPVELGQPRAGGPHAAAPHTGRVRQSALWSSPFKGCTAAQSIL